MKNGDGYKLALGAILIVAGFLCHRTTVEDFAKHTPHEFGRTARAKVVQIDELDTFGRKSQRVTVEYKDEHGTKRQGVLEGTGFAWFKTGNGTTISYQPGYYTQVRWPKGRMRDQMHRRWLMVFKLCMFLGFALGAHTLVRDSRHA